MVRGDARHPGEGIQAGAAGQSEKEPLGGVAGGVCDEQWAAAGGATGDAAETATCIASSASYVFSNRRRVFLRVSF